MANTTTSNASLPKPIDESFLMQDVENLEDAHNNSMDILERCLAGIQTAAVTGVNASIINTRGNRIVQLQVTSAGCIASITGAIRGMPFTMLFQSVGSIGMSDVGGFILSAALTPAVNAAISFVWDGTNFIEIGRSAN
jgi:hypothetical protein